MAVTPGMLSSIKQDWETPKEFVGLVENYLNLKFTLDPCCYTHTAKATKFFTEKENGLAQTWTGETVWMNPPYGKELVTWLDYAHTQSKQLNTIVVCLIPARTDTQWFHSLATKGKIIFLEGRINFLQSGKLIGSPAFPSMLVVYGEVDTLPLFSTWKWKSK